MNCIIFISYFEIDIECKKKRDRNGTISVIPVQEKTPSMVVGRIPGLEAERPDNQRDGGKRADCTAKVDQGDNQEDTRGPVFPESLQCRDIPGQIFQITHPRPS